MPSPWPLGSCAAPADRLGRELDDVGEPAGVDRVDRRRDRRSSSSSSTMPDGLEVDLARRADQLEQEVLRVLAQLVGELGHEGLHREGVRDVRDRAEPADPDVRLRLAVLAAEVRRSSNGMSTRPMPSSKAACSFGSGMKVDMIVGATLRCRHADDLAVGVERRPRSARPRWCGRSRCWMSSSRVQCTLTGAPPISLERSAASSAKSHFDLRPKPPPSSVTLTVTFSIGRPSVLASVLAGAVGALHRGPDLALAAGDDGRGRPAAPSARAPCAAGSTRP